MWALARGCGEGIHMATWTDKRRMIEEEKEVGCGHKGIRRSSKVDKRVRDYFIRTNLDLVLLGVVVAGYSYAVSAATDNVDATTNSNKTTTPAGEENIHHQVERAGKLSWLVLMHLHAPSSCLTVNPSSRLVNRACCFLSLVCPGGRHRRLLRP